MSEQILENAGDAAKQIVAHAVDSTGANAKSVGQAANKAIDHAVAQGKALYNKVDAQRLTMKHDGIAAEGRFHEWMSKNGLHLVYGILATGIVVVAAAIAGHFLH